MQPLSIVAVHCSSHAAAIDGSLAPSEGDAEMMSIRDEWHRAVIVSAEVLPVLSSSRYVCRLLDTGVTVRVTHEHVRQLPTTAAFLAAQVCSTRFMGYCIGDSRVLGGREAVGFGARLAVGRVDRVP